YLESPSTIDALSVSMGMKLTKIIIHSSQNPIQINEKRETLNRSVPHVFRLHMGINPRISRIS
ncbi:11554_t:CDS:2, partial [Funneliformis geosporum]